MSIIDDIEGAVRNRPGTSFPEIKRHLADQGYRVEGEWVIELKHNTLLWANLSEELFNGIIEARNKGVIHAHPLLSDFEVLVIYGGDGAMLRLPIAYRPPKNGYKDPHWLPVVFHLGSHCSSKNCPGVGEGVPAK